MEANETAKIEANETALASPDVEATTDVVKPMMRQVNRKRGKVKRMMAAGTRMKKGVKKVNTVRMRLQKGVLHIVSNSVVPGTDVSSDFLTFLELWEKGDIGWAAAVLFFMFVPFFFKMGEFLVDLCRGKVKENNVVGLFLHLPFVAPIVHLSLGLRILLIDPTKPENLSSIEKVAKAAALGSMYEAFLEAGPQLQLQLHIILSTGRPTKTQLVSIVLSTLSLTLASCRAFFVQRSPKFADPEPNIHMILRVFPYMLVQVLQEILNMLVDLNMCQVLSASLEWSVISMIKKFTFVAILVSTYLTWHSTFLFKETETGDIKDRGNLSSSALLPASEKKENEGPEAQEGDNSNHNKEATVQGQVLDTCSALWRCLCALGLCCFTPFTSSCCRFARGENPYSFTFYLSAIFGRVELTL